MDHMQIANTIRTQLGANKFTAMTGAKNMVATGNGLQFQVPGGMGRKAFTTLIELSGHDLYNVSIWKGSVLNMKKVEEKTGVSAENLRSVFEQMTGLRTSL